MEQQDPVDEAEADDLDPHSSLAGWRRLEAMAAERKRVAAARDNP